MIHFLDSLLFKIAPIPEKEITVLAFQKIVLIRF